MARITVERVHQLGLLVARIKAEQLAERLRQEFGVTCCWQGDVLAVKRSGAEGSVEVGEDRVRVRLNLGLLLSPMASSIQRRIEQVLDKVLCA